jgi:site-specific recombinase XerD
MKSDVAPDRVRMSGPLTPFADGFGAQLLERGYSLWSVQFHLQFLAHVSRWLEAEGLEVSGLTPQAVDEFLAERRRQGYVARLSPKATRPLLEYLDGLGVLPVEAVASTPVERVLDAFSSYLLEERGLVPESVQLYARVARRFLEERPEPLDDALARLSGAEINAFVLRESRRVGQRTAETVVCSLRSLLRFLHVQGVIGEPLALVVPSVARRREDLPRRLAAREVKLLLDSCDRSAAIGRRDYAILKLLARLGLRCGEVAVLKLDDVDWRAGAITVRGKGSKLDLLPLPSDVGEALADYLCQGRPRGFGRTMFLRSSAPLVGLSSNGVSCRVLSACKRAGIPPAMAHRLRHTVASELVGRGAGLPEVGQVLRHQRLQTTAIYAKVDRSALSSLALPWPGSQS